MDVAVASLPAIPTCSGINNTTDGRTNEHGIEHRKRMFLLASRLFWTERPALHLTWQGHDHSLHEGTTTLLKLTRSFKEMPRF